MPATATAIQRLPPQDGRDWDCQCARCGSHAQWRECEECEDGFDGHDCGEDCCMCRYPEDNVECGFCHGWGGEYWCISTAEFCEANPMPGRSDVERGEIEWFTFDDPRTNQGDRDASNE